MLQLPTRFLGLLLTVAPAALVPTTIVTAQDLGTTYHLRVDESLTESQYRLLQVRYGAGCGVVESPKSGVIELYLHPEEYAEVQRLGIRTTVLGRGRPYAEVARQSARTPLVSNTNYFTPVEILAEIDRFARTYPRIARRVDLTAYTGTAKTFEGRSIYALKISDNVAVDEDEPGILMASQHHARELTTPVIVFGAIDRILRGYAANATLKRLVDGHEIYCVPCVNPDGLNKVWTRDRWWRKNTRGGYGVDINRNFPFLWGRCGASSNTRSQIYKGPSAGSESETRTMMALQRMLRPEIYLDFHAYGQEVLFTYAPCASVNSAIRGLLNSYATDLRRPMNYATRAPSASGEAPEFHWADGGSMAFLTEVGRSFQPSYASALSEVGRAWPGIQRAVTTWRPAVRGHVRSIFKDQPIAATIRFTPNRFNHGERTVSRARDGRFGLWLPLGSHQVTFSAAGFRSVTKTVRVTSYNNPTNLEIYLVPNMAAARISKSGPDRIGQTTNLTYTSPSDVGEIYWVLLSLGTRPGIPVGAGRVVPLNADVALRASLPPSILTNNFGRLPPNGQVTAGFPIPNIVEFVGLTVYAGGVTENSDYLSFVKNFSPAIPITIRR